MAQNITLLGANYPDVPAVTLPITGGGTATFSDTRSVTYNLSGGASASVTPSEVVAEQGFSLKLKAPAGYNLNGVTVTMGGVDITEQVFEYDEAGGGGSSEQSETGTFTGNNGITVQIPCSFEPDLIRVYADLSGAVSLRGIASLTFIKNDSMYVFSDTSSSSSDENAMYWILHDMVGFNNSSEPHASYANGVLTIDMISNTSAFRFASGVSYTYKLSTLP